MRDEHVERVGFLAARRLGLLLLLLLLLAATGARRDLERGARVLLVHAAAGGDVPYLDEALVAHGHDETVVDVGEGLRHKQQRLDRLVDGDYAHLGERRQVPHDQTLVARAAYNAVVSCVLIANAVALHVLEAGDGAEVAAETRLHATRVQIVDAQIAVLAGGYALLLDAQIGIEAAVGDDALSAAQVVRAVLTADVPHLGGEVAAGRGQKARRRVEAHVRDGRRVDGLPRARALARRANRRRRPRVAVFVVVACRERVAPVGPLLEEEIAMSGDEVLVVGRESDARHLLVLAVQLAASEARADVDDVHARAVYAQQIRAARAHAHVAARELGLLHAIDAQT